MPVSNVPAPGSPIRSNWAISVSNIANANEAAIPLRVVKSGDTMSGTLTVGNVPESAGPTPGVSATPTGRITMAGSSTDATSTPNMVIGRGGSPAAGVGGQYVRFDRGGSAIGMITIASATTVAYNTSSDPRLKENVGPITDAAARVLELGRSVYRGRWIGDEADAPVWDLFDAPDVAAVAPYAVTGEPDAVTAEGTIDPMQVNLGALVPLLTAALADALERIAALEAR